MELAIATIAMLCIIAVSIGLANRKGAGKRAIAKTYHLYWHEL